jgi:hypothetical protein
LYSHWDWYHLPLFKVALIFIFSLGAIGTAVTALRLHKIVEMHTVYAREPGSVRWFVVAAHVLLLSEIECCIILMCANLPALAAWLKKRNYPNAHHADAAAAAAAAAAATAAGRQGSAAVLASTSASSCWSRRFLRRAPRQHHRYLGHVDAAENGARCSGGVGCGGMAAYGVGGGREKEDTEVDG